MVGTREAHKLLWWVKDGNRSALATVYSTPINFLQVTGWCPYLGVLRRAAPHLYHMYTRPISRYCYCIARCATRPIARQKKEVHGRNTVGKFPGDLYRTLSRIWLRDACLHRNATHTSSVNFIIGNFWAESITLIKNGAAKMPGSDLLHPRYAFKCHFEVPELRPFRHT